MATPPFPDKKYDILYADPPWAWSKSPLINRGSARTVEKEYPTMQPDEIMALPISNIAEDQSVLFLWATSPKLDVALATMAAWGFEFRTVAFVWVKKNRRLLTNFMGMGFYTRQNSEFVLLGVRGKPLTRLDRSVHQIVEAPVCRHSSKPAEVRSRIDRLYDGSRIELFARSGSDPVWNCWGFDSKPSSMAIT